MVAAAGRRPRPPRRTPICVRLGGGWWADAFAAQLQAQAVTAAPGHRYRLIAIDTDTDTDTDTLSSAVAQHRARGLILRSPADSAVVAEVESLVRRDVSVVTVGSDLPAPNRTGYAGTRSIRAGSLVATRLLEAAPDVQAVLMLAPGGWHYADIDLEQGMRQTLRRAGVDLVTVTAKPDEQRSDLRARVHAAVAADPAIRAVFALGAGAGDALDVLRGQGRGPVWAGAWGQSPEHQALLREGALDLVAGTSLAAEAALALQLLVGLPALGQPGRTVRPEVQFWDQTTAVPST